MIHYKYLNRLNFEFEYCLLHPVITGAGDFPSDSRPTSSLAQSYACAIELAALHAATAVPRDAVSQLSAHGSQ